ncbi:MAG TPA: C1 family peptidase, partial [Chitinophagaceae bacterium]|nr:C1 family peptidase [Chitinophagaceae bacterium]
MRRSHLLLAIVVPTICHAQQFTIKQLGLKAPSSINCTPVKDQYLSATCWSFSSNSLLESELLRKGKTFDLSEMFVARYSMIRKIHRHLKLKGQNFFTPGGQFHDLVWVVRNHGLVPETAYPGKPGMQVNHNHGELDTIISHFVKDMVSRGITEMNRSQESFVDSVLDRYLGKVPATFDYEGTVYTPHSFVERVLELDMNDYVEITSYTHHPFYKPFVLEDKYNWTGDEYYNVPLSDLSRITDNALAKGFTAGWDGDATDPYFQFSEGLAWLQDTILDYPAFRQSSFNNESTLLDHMMHI